MVRLGKLFLLITSLALLTACGTTSQYTSYSTVSSVNNQYVPPESTVSVVRNMFVWQTYMMSKEDKRRQEQAVFFLLDHGKPGDTTNWYNAETNSQGIVTIWQTHPMGSGYCKIIISQITYKNKTRDYQERACINSVEKKWTFIR